MPALTGNTALDVAIGLAFVYLLFSVLCAAVQEAIAGIFDLRASTLEKGLRNLLQDDGRKATGAAPAAVAGAAPPGAADPVTPEQGEKPGGLTDLLLSDGLIRTLYKQSALPFGSRRRGPSYIPSRTFALALLNVIDPADPNRQETDLRKAIADSEIIPEGTRSALLSLAVAADNDRDRLRDEIARWFDGTMARVSGWYKRKTQVIICLLSLIVAVGLNVNTVGITDRLINDDAVRAAVVQDAVKTPLRPGQSLNDVANEVTHVERLGLPLGWSKSSDDPARASFSDHLGRTLAGWLLTFLALSLGAPFWFDALSKLAGLRNTGTPAKPGTSTST
jgi:hypothetical protein